MGGRRRIKDNKREQMGVQEGEEMNRTYWAYVLFSMLNGT